MNPKKGMGDSGSSIDGSGKYKWRILSVDLGGILFVVGVVEILDVGMGARAVSVLQKQMEIALGVHEDFILDRPTLLQTLELNEL